MHFNYCITQKKVLKQAGVVYNIKSQQIYEANKDSET